GAREPAYTAANGKMRLRPSPLRAGLGGPLAPIDRRQAQARRDLRLDEGSAIGARSAGKGVCRDERIQPMSISFGRLGRLTYLTRKNKTTTRQTTEMESFVVSSF